MRKGNVFTSMCQEFSPQGGCIPACTGADTPTGHLPPVADTPQGRHPLPTVADTPSPSGQTPSGQTLPWQTPPGRHYPRQTPPCPSGHCSRWYASYWNAFFWGFIFVPLFPAKKARQHLYFQVCQVILKWSLLWQLDCAVMLGIFIKSVQHSIKYDNRRSNIKSIRTSCLVVNFVICVLSCFISYSFVQFCTLMNLAGIMKLASILNFW